MLANYLPILVFIIMGVGFGVLPLIAGAVLAPKQPNAAKSSAYECGFNAFGDARLPFDVRYCLIAILFIVFDLETAFFFPWSVVFRQLGWMGFWSMMVFLGLLVVGYIFEWKKGALTWE